MLLFACWWLYFLDSDAPKLEARRDLRFIWGYGHFFVFAALAAIGAGIEVTVEAITHEVAASRFLVGYSVAVPLAIFLAARYALYVQIGGSRLARRELIAAEIAIVLAIPLASVVLSPAWVLASLAAAAAGLVAFKSMQFGLVSADAVADTPRVSGHHQDGRHEGSQVPEGGTTIPSQGHSGRAAD